MRRLARLQARHRPRSSSDQLDETERLRRDGEHVDLVQTFAFPMPFLVICELLGLPRRGAREVPQARPPPASTSPAAASGPSARSAARASSCFAEAARQRKDPGPGLIGQIIREHGDEITDFDLGGLADGAFTGGLETSASMLALGTAVLLERPRALGAGWSPTRPASRPIVDELLRHALGRAGRVPALRQARRRGRRHSRSARARCVLVHLPAADRDPRSYPPATASTSRGRPRPTWPSATASTAASAPSWPGWSCGRRTPPWPARFPDLALAVRPRSWTYHAKSIVYGVESVPVRLHP